MSTTREAQTVETGNGTVTITRNTRNALDLFKWEDGRFLRVHDDGRVTVGRANSTANVRNTDDVKVHGPFPLGSTAPGINITITFHDLEEQAH